MEGVDFTEKAFIILDEIQLVHNITSVIKYIYDTYNVKFIITGSSSLYMKGQFSESLAGRKHLFEMWPLSFDEFLQFKQAGVTLPDFSFKHTPHFFIRLLKPFVTNPDREIALQKKLYFTDSGLLNMMGQNSSGAIFENTIANQLFTKGTLQYYAKKNGKEIDFILNGNRAFEIKETPTPYDLKILKNRSLSIGIKQYHLVGKTPPGSGFNDFIWGGAIY